MLVPVELGLIYDGKHFIEEDLVKIVCYEAFDIGSKSMVKISNQIEGYIQWFGTVREGETFGMQEEYYVRLLAKDFKKKDEYGHIIICLTDINSIEKIGNANDE